MTSSSRPDTLFKYRHFDLRIIILCVRWYLSYKLGYRDLVEMVAERRVELAHTTVLRWVRRFMPEFEKRCQDRGGGPAQREISARRATRKEQKQYED